ncbi:uncharacterized protein TNCV_5063361 [Trichonephila clavipes]|nr:uncharacterized protein TNCV_5063361 [Trichonephila clavipes]
MLAKKAFKKRKKLLSIDRRVSFRAIAQRLGWKVSTVHDCWEQWSRDGRVSRSSSRPRGITERKHRRIQRAAETHRTASVTEIRAEMGTTVTQRAVRYR